MDVARVTRLFIRELHLDIPGQAEVVRESVEEAYRSYSDPVEIASFLAVRIQDGLGYIGEPLDNHWNPDALKDWKGHVARKFYKALRLGGALVGVD